MGSDSDINPLIWRQSSRTEAIDKAISGYATGQLNRRAFIQRAALLGLTIPSITTILAACAASSSPTPASAAPASAALASAAPSAAPASPSPAASGKGTALADVQTIVYPAGTNSRKAYQGPNNSTQDAAPLPLDYHTTDGMGGTWHWKFDNFIADKPYRLAYCNASAKYDTGVELGFRMKALAASLGCSIDIFDNNFDADTTIKNADLVIQGGYDYCNEFSVLPDVNKTVFNKFKAAGIGVNFLAIEATGEPTAPLLDGDNFGRSQQVGAYIGKYVNDHFGGQVDLVILGAQPKTGAYAATRETGFLAGLKSVVPSIPDSKVKTIDTDTGLLDVAQTKATDLLTATPNAKYIVGWGTNDDAAVGIVRALEAAGRDKFAAVGGQGGLPSAIAELQKPENAFKCSVFFDNGEWTWMTSIGVLALMGGQTAVYNLIPAPLYDRTNISTFPPQIVFSKA